MIGLIARKLGMTQVVDVDGDMIPVTVLQADETVIADVMTVAKNGYDAVRIATEPVKAQRLNKANRTFFEKKKLDTKRKLKEFRINPSLKEEYKAGQQVTVELFAEGEFVDVQGTSIGKGFQGAIKRWGQSRGPETHGSMYHRRPGSAGASSYPSRTWPGQHMPGRMGGDTKTVQNILVMKVLKDDNTILVKGAVPGSRNSKVVIQKALKRTKKLDLSKSKYKAASAEQTAKKTAKKK